MWPEGLRKPPHGSSEGLLKAPEGSRDVLLRLPRPAPLRRADSLSGVRLRARASTPWKSSASKTGQTKNYLKQRWVRQVGGDSLQGPSRGAKGDVKGGEAREVCQVRVRTGGKQSRHQLAKKHIKADNMTQAVHRPKSGSYLVMARESRGMEGSGPVGEVAQDGVVLQELPDNFVVALRDNKDCWIWRQILRLSSDKEENRS